MTTGASAPAVAMRGIVKRFPGVVANDGIDLELAQGEIHALLGENGAGKTTLMNILYGIYQPEEGEIRIHGKPARIRSPRAAIDLGIGMIHQHFRLVTTHSVAENIVLGLDGDFFSPDRAAMSRIRELSRRYGLAVDPEAPIWELSAGEQQRVEILKALYRGAQILILDEPTSMLAPQEIDGFLATLRQMADDGRTIAFITHKLEEVTATSDRVTVLRKGGVVGTYATRQTDKASLAEKMVGREVLFRIHKEAPEIGAPALRIEHLSANDDRGLPALKSVSLAVHRGEILALAGVAGNGQRELVETLLGLRPPTAGRVFLGEREITNLPVRARIDLGLGCVPSERGMAYVGGLSVAENLVLKSYRRPPFSRNLFLDRRSIRSSAARLIEAFQISTPGPRTPLKLLSGGNIQRALLAREVSGEPALLIAANPSSGLDVGATEHIWQLLLEQRKRGVAVLVVSEDLDEVMTLGDRVAVLFAGEIMGILPTPDAAREKLGLMMAGSLRLPVEENA